MSKKTAIYVITNVLNGKHYVGITINLKRRWKDHLESKYLIGRALRKYGVSNFLFEHIADAFDYDSAKQIERTLIKELNTLKPNGYNLTEGGEGILGYKFSEISKQKQREKKLGKKASEEAKKKMSVSGKARLPRSEETCKKLSDALKGKPKSKESVAKRLETMAGFKHSEETKQKMSEQRSSDKNPLRGRILSEEQKTKISVSVSKSLIGNTRTLGYKHKEETIEKMRQAHVNRDYTESTAKRLATMVINKTKKSLEMEFAK